MSSATRYFAVVAIAGKQHRLGIIDGSGFVLLDGPKASKARRTFGREERAEVLAWCHRKKYALRLFRPIDPYPMLEVDSDTRLPHPSVARALNLLARRMGRKLRINEGTRTRARQQALWNAHPDPRYVARPGTSRHEDHDGDGWGDAADVVDAVDGENLRPMVERRGLMEYVKELGLDFPMEYEPWHIERRR